jgi:hypothetical protein
MSEVKQGVFEGWAIVEMMGHQREIGFVTTEAYGQAVMFRVDVPELTEREFVLNIPEYSYKKHCTLPAGSKVKREGKPGYTRLVAPSSLYAINPCTQETALATFERSSPRPLLLIEIAQGQSLLEARAEADLEDEDEASEGFDPRHDG